MFPGAAQLGEVVAIVQSLLHAILVEGVTAAYARLIKSANLAIDDIHGKPDWLSKLKVVCVYYINVGSMVPATAPLPLAEEASPHVPGLMTTWREGANKAATSLQPQGGVVVGTIRMGYGHHRIAYATTSWALGMDKKTCAPRLRGGAAAGRRERVLSGLRAGTSTTCSTSTRRRRPSSRRWTTSTRRSRASRPHHNRLPAPPLGASPTHSTPAAAAAARPARPSSAPSSSCLATSWPTGRRPTSRASSRSSRRTSARSRQPSRATRRSSPASRMSGSRPSPPASRAALGRPPRAAPSAAQGCSQRARLAQARHQPRV